MDEKTKRRVQKSNLVNDRNWREIENQRAEVQKKGTARKLFDCLGRGKEKGTRKVGKEVTKEFTPCAILLVHKGGSGSRKHGLTKNSRKPRDSGGGGVC